MTMKRLTVVALASILILSFVGLLRAEGVLKTGMDSPQQVVQTRKYLMHTAKLNAEDAAQKFEAGNIGAIQANGAALELSAKVMPPLYKEKYEGAYAGQGKYFKGAATADFEAAAETMRAAAQQVRMSAEKGDRDAVAQAMGEVQQTCGACHKAYRGDF
jgi:cytochrome c556